MTNESTTVEANATSPASDSRTIDDSASMNALGRGQHLPEGEQKQEDAKPLSTREAIAKAFDDNQKAAEEKAKAAVDEAKAKVAEADPRTLKQPDQKVEKTRAEDGKFAKTEAVADVKADKSAPEAAAAERSAPEDRQSEGRKYSEPPARFLPEAREKWAPTPYAVKAELHRVMQEMETETERFKQSHEVYETIREFDEKARASGTDLKTALQSYTNIENLLHSNPARGIAEVLRNIGLTPEQYAQHVLQNPQAHQFTQAAQQPVQQAQPQQNPEIESLRAEIQEMKAQTIMPTINQFVDSHPDYHALEDKILEVLKSGVVEKLYGAGLSVEQKLAEAYRMVGGRGAPSHPDPVNSAENSQPKPLARPIDPDGQKSIKGAPTNGQSAEAPKRFKSNRDALEAAFSAYAR